MTDEAKKEEPKVETKEPEKQNELQAMLTKLNELGITKPEQLDNKAKAASEAGRLANIVGELREEIASLKSRPAETPKPEYESDGVDIDAAIGNAVNKALEAREAKARQQHMARLKEVQSLRNDEDYSLVGKDFERFMSTPQAQIALSNGATPTAIYHKMVKGKYRSLMVDMKSAVEATTGIPGQVAMPHMESSQTAPPKIEPSDEKRSKLKSIKENWRGDDNDLSASLRAILPDELIPV